MKATGLIFILISCILFSVVVTAEEVTLTDEKNVTGNNSRNARIVGGEIAQTKYRKGVALIYVTDDGDGYISSSCTGSIIGRKWILSAAHCFESDWSEFYVPWFGVIPASWYADTRAVDTRGIEVKNLYVHKDYNFDDSQYDIAILELEKEIPLEYYNKVEIVDLPPDNTKVKAVGYGHTKYQGWRPEVVQMVDVVYRNFEFCEPRDTVGAPLSETNQMCAVSLDYPLGKTDTCQGDSGGPLFLKRADSKLQQIGITSYGPPCAVFRGIPWYVRAQRFSWGINDLLTNGKWGPYHKFNKISFNDMLRSNDLLAKSSPQNSTRI